MNYLKHKSFGNCKPNSNYQLTSYSLAPTAEGSYDPYHYHHYHIPTEPPTTYHQYHTTTYHLYHTTRSHSRVTLRCPCTLHPTMWYGLVNLSFFLFNNNCLYNLHTLYVVTFPSLSFSFILFCTTRFNFAHYMQCDTLYFTHMQRTTGSVLYLWL